MAFIKIITDFSLRSNVKRLLVHICILHNFSIVFHFASVRMSAPMFLFSFLPSSSCFILFFFFLPRRPSTENAKCFRWTTSAPSTWYTNVVAACFHYLSTWLARCCFHPQSICKFVSNFLKCLIPGNASEMGMRNAKRHTFERMVWTIAIEVGIGARDGHTEEKQYKQQSIMDQ